MGERNENNAKSALTKVEVKVEAELGKKTVPITKLSFNFNSNLLKAEIALFSISPHHPPNPEKVLNGYVLTKCGRIQEFVAELAQLFNF